MAANDQEKVFGKDSQINVVLSPDMNSTGTIDLVNVFHNMKVRRRFFAWVLLLCMVMGVSAMLLVSQFTKPMATVSSLVTYDYDVIEEENEQNRKVEPYPVTDLTAPDGKPLDLEQITSAYVLQQAIDMTPLSESITVEALRRNIRIQRNLTENSKRQQEVAAQMVTDKNNAAYTTVQNLQLVYENKVVVSLTNGFSTDEESISKTVLPDGELQALLNNILNAYNDFMVLTYANKKLPDDAFHLIGHSGTDAVLAGQILPAASSGSAVGLVKEGSGTYRITGTGCNINAGIRILEGSVLVNNEIKVSSVYAFGKGLLGGSGKILGNADIYGKVNPGDGLVGTLNVSGMQVHPSSRLCIDIVDADRHDCMEIDGSLQYSNICEDFSLSEDLPIIKVRLAENHAVNVGDEFVLIRSGSKSRFQDKEWNFKVVLPSEHTWKVEERTIDGKYCVVLTVTSLEDDPANAGNDKEDETEEGDDEEENNTTYGDDGDRRQIRYYADKTDKLLGVAVSTWYQSLGDESQDAVRVIFNNFNTIVAENEMKFENTEPSRGHFSFGAADQIVSFAAKHNMTVRGHTLAWHSQCPEWVSSDGKKNDKGWTREELLSVLKNHVDKMVRHFKGKVTEWDVVNECLDDDQSILRTNPDGYKLRSASVWTTVIGEDFIDSAFVWAHRADPDARLFLNDYDVEFMGKAKTQALYNLARRLQNDGIPIDGVGLQCHLDVGNVDSAALNSNVARYKDLNLLVELTEVDLGTSSATSANLQAQARNYHTLTNIMLNNDNCTGMVIWGVADNISWRSGSNPLLFANGMVRKPAFYAVRSAFRDYVTTDIPIMDSGNARRPLSYCHADGTWTITNSSGSRIVLKEGKKVMVVQ